MGSYRKMRFVPVAVAVVALLGVAADFDMSKAQGQDSLADAVKGNAVGAVTYNNDNDTTGTSIFSVGTEEAARTLAEAGEGLLSGSGVLAAGEDDEAGRILASVGMPSYMGSPQANGDGEDDSANASGTGSDGLPGDPDSQGENGQDSSGNGEGEGNPAPSTDIPDDASSNGFGDGVTDNGDANLPDDITDNTIDSQVGSDDELYLPDGLDQEGPAPEIYVQGVTHSSVADIQQRLMDLGFMDYSEPTMYYGPITAEAVKLFQRQNDLTQDGILGPKTMEMLFAEDAKFYLAKAGMQGDDIKRIQLRLYELGYLAKEEYLTGYFGDITEAAVKQMQQSNGLAADGMVGQDTFEMLYSEDAKANLLSYGDKSDVVLACQERLKELGYLTTKPDGQYGSDTVAAVKQFQSRNDLVVDGYLGPSTMIALNSQFAVPNGLVLGDSGDTVKRVQELLARYGYMSSANNTGYFGELTEAAVKAFQKNNGLSVDGNVGMKTMEKLTSGNVVRAGETASSGGSSSGGSSGSSGGSSSGGSSGAKTASVSSLLAVAKSKLGCPYVYGAKGPNSFDCSGFVYWCLNQVGIKQSYITSYGWRTVGKYQKITSFSSIKAGDIVVVKGHVGIAAGNGMVYDASSSSGKIVYRSLGSWWKNNFIVAWRIF